MRRPAARSGSVAEHALRATYEAEFGRLVGLARLLVDRTEDAEEVVQEAFARTWARLGQVDGDPLPYVRKAVVNQSRGRLRRRHTAAAHRPERAVEAEAADVTAERHRAAGVVLARVRQLPTRQRECVILRFYEDLTVPEIGRVLGLAEGSVKSHLHRGLAALAVGLEEER